MYVMNIYLKIVIYETIIRPVVLYGAETWTLTGRDEERDYLPGKGNYFGKSTGL
jgi:hypothetical protein